MRVSIIVPHQNACSIAGLILSYSDNYKNTVNVKIINKFYVIEQDEMKRNVNLFKTNYKLHMNKI